VILCLFRQQASLHPLFQMGPVMLNTVTYGGDVIE